MKQRVLVGVVFVPLLLVIMLFLPDIVFSLVVALISAVCAYEFLRAVGADKNRRIAVYAVVSAVILALNGHHLRVYTQFSTMLFLLVLLMFVEAVAAYKTERELALKDILSAIFAGAIIPYFLSKLTALNLLGNEYVLIPFVVAFITDAGAYFVGVFLGKRKAFPNVSPKKTIEGCIGGVCIGVISTVLYGLIVMLVTDLEPNFLSLIVIGLVGAVVTEIGDLAFSLIKREYDVKDFGNLLPGHGGMLDRFDSMVFCAPAVSLMMAILPVF